MVIAAIMFVITAAAVYIAVVMFFSNRISFKRSIGIEMLPTFNGTVARYLSNGGYFKYYVVDSEFWFSVERFDGSDVRATINLRIPRQQQIIDVWDSLRSTLDSNGYEIVEQHDNPSLIAIISVRLENIWADEAVARVTHAVRLLFQIIGISNSAKLRVEEIGTVVHRTDPTKT